MMSTYVSVRHTQPAEGTRKMKKYPPTPLAHETHGVSRETHGEFFKKRGEAEKKHGDTGKGRGETEKKRGEAGYKRRVVKKCINRVVSERKRGKS